jgi:hypothetical protein
MFRSYLIAAGAALLCTSAAAQQKLDPSRMYPITSPIKNAGTVDVTTGKWTKPAQQVKTGSSTIFNNTCTWTGGGFYAGFDWCEDNYDEGRIPSGDALDTAAPPGAQVNNQILSVQVSYCTWVGPILPGPGYDMDVAFFDHLGGDCAGLTPPTPPVISGQANTGGWLPLLGLGLPGSTTMGFQACWLITLDTSNTGLVILGDGDGVFNADGTDKFNWMQRQNHTVGPVFQALANPDGFIIAGEPATGGFGACSYNVPCGSDAVFGGTCGTGLDSFDGSWINVDGIGVLDSSHNTACANAVSQYGYGTNCYYFGGYPTNPLASYWLVLEGDARSECFTAFCPQTKVTSVTGCTASMTVSNCTLATGTWDGTDIPRHTSLGTGTVVGIFIYTRGPGIGQSAFSANVPFGTLCVNNFLRSGPAVLAGALAGVCNTGVMTRAMATMGGAVPLQVGDDFNAMLWYRDPIPANNGNANFSNACFGTVL